MVYVPKDAKWYVAEIVEEVVVAGDPRNVVHRNLVLIRADSPDEAYAKALEIGSQHEGSYTNPDGRLVRTSFRGLSHLDVIHDGLEHGAELTYERKTSVPEEEISKWVLSKDQLPLFQDRGGKPDYPDYASKSILEEAEKLIESAPPNQS
jgi:hypothetical protein